MIISLLKIKLIKKNDKLVRNFEKLSIKKKKKKKKKKKEKEKDMIWCTKPVCNARIKKNGKEKKI
jgi:hypothetical protein